MTGKTIIQQPLVSVIIPVYNGEKYLKETIESVIAQTEKNWEIVAINDGSTDMSLAILTEYEKSNPNQIHVISIENVGVSKARNIGVEQSRGKYIAFLDQDDLWTPQKLEHQISMFSHDDMLGISFTNVSIIDKNREIIKYGVLKLDERYRGNVFEKLLFDNFIGISSVMIKRDLFQKIGGFDPQFRVAEDFDFLLKVTRIYPVDYVDEPMLLYREHGDSGTFKKINRIIIEANIILKFWKIQYPELFHRNFFQYVIFKMRLRMLKGKVFLKNLFEK